MTDRDTAPRRLDAAASVVLYTQPHCSACRSVERYLVERDVRFDVRDVFDDPSALEDIESRGYLTTPVTRVGVRWIAGFRRAAFDDALAALDQ